MTTKLLTVYNQTRIRPFLAWPASHLYTRTNSHCVEQRSTFPLHRHSNLAADHNTECKFNVMLSVNLRQLHNCKSLSLSVRFNSHFPGGPGLAGTRMFQFRILFELRMMEVVAITGVIRHAKL